MSNTGEVQSDIRKPFKNSGVCTKVPDCPYRHLMCVNYDCVLEKGLCQPHTNRHYKSVRCDLLPSWVPDGWHVAVLCEGYLSIRHDVGGR